MAEFDLSHETAVLDEFIEIKPQKGRLFDGVISSSLLYMVFVLIYLVADNEGRSFKTFDWSFGIAMLFLPFTGTIFCFIGKKIGWIINFFYYLLITSLAFYTIGRDFFVRESFGVQSNWRGFLIFIFAFSSTAFLSSTPMRRYFRISSLLFIIMLLVSVGLALTMALTAME